MRHIYPAFFYEEFEGGYSVFFPDFEGATSGSTLQEAHYMAVDFLYCQLTDIVENRIVPKASDINTIKPKACSDEWTYKSVFSTLVAVDVKEYEKYLADKNKSVRKNVTIPKWIDELAQKQHINFSSVLQDALRQQLGM